MAFPEAERVIYEKNPLIEVICQLRFPPILKIDAEPPAAFQERVRAKFPFYQAKSAIKPPGGIPADLARILAHEIPMGLSKTAHDFSSADRQWRLSLTREFIALTCSKYERWEAFKDWFAGAVDALLDVYSPTFFTRVGLRYRDVIRRSALGLSDEPWSTLIQPWLIGPLCDEAIGPLVEQSTGDFVIELADQPCRVHVQHGITQEAPNDEPCYLIDADLFQDQNHTETTDAQKRFDYLNAEARRFFRWCIHERLHRAMGPRPVAVD